MSNCIETSTRSTSVTVEGFRKSKRHPTNTMASNKPNLLNKEKLLKQVRRMNAKLALERTNQAQSIDDRIAELRDAADSCIATMQRLRGEREGPDYFAAKQRRDEIYVELERLQHDLDPRTEFEKVDQAITAAKIAVSRLQYTDSASTTLQLETAISVGWLD